MLDYQHIDSPSFHFSFLKDTKFHGIYFNTLNRYLSQYPFIKKEHFHDFYSILFFYAGTGTIHVNGDSYVIQPPSIYLIAPDQLHSFEDLNDAHGLVFFFCQDFYVEEFSFIRLLNVFSCTSRLNGGVCNPCIKVEEGKNDPVVEIIRSISREYENHNNSNNSPVIIRSLLNILLLKLYELNDRKTISSVNGDAVLINELSHIIDSNFVKEHHVGFYTSAINVSEKQLNELCNRNFNCGLKKILTDRLMQEARKLLMSSDLSVSEISYKMNFDDNSYFNKVFKKQTGLTPLRFREIHKNLVP